MIFLLVILGWMAIGFIATNISGCLLKNKLMKYFSENSQECERRIDISVMASGYDPKPSFLNLLWNDLTWPISIYYATKGYRKIKSGGKKK